MKSVCRLMPIYNELPVQKNSEHKIDDIRKKLRAMRHINKSLNNQNINIEGEDRQLQPSPRKGLYVTINKLKKENLPISKTEVFFSHLQKIKTEAQELPRDLFFKPQVLKSKPCMQLSSSKNIRATIQCDDNLSYKNIFRNFRVSEELKSLKKSNKVEVQYDQVVQNKNAVMEANEDMQNKPMGENKSFSLKEFTKKPITKVRTDSRRSKISSNSRSSGIYSKQIFYVKNLNNCHEFAQFVGLTNGIFVNGDKTQIDKFYVGRGNNDELVKKLLRKRGLVETHKIKDANIVWTQKRDFRLMDSMVNIQYKNAEHKQTKKINSFKWRCQCHDLNYNKQCTLSKLTKQKLINGHQSIVFNKLWPEQIKILPANSKIKTHNHLLHHEEICHKKNLLHNLKHYYEAAGVDPFQHLPLTFHIEKIQDNERWELFLTHYKQSECSWIIKPGENTNRGQGIIVERELNKIRKVVDEIISSKSTAIVQKYIVPVLYMGRKFDIRCYALATVVNGYFNLYWYEQGYVRTASKAFNMDDNSRYIHLTNDAVQKHCADYGKYEVSNKLSFENLENYLKQKYHIDFFSTVYPQMKKLCFDAFDSTWQKLHADGKDYCYEIFGLDFMIDDHLKVWLIEVNRNPCIQTPSPTLKNIITPMLDNAFMIANDVFFKPKIKASSPPEKVETKFNLIFKRKL